MKHISSFGIMIANSFKGQGFGQIMVNSAIEECDKYNKDGILITTAKINHGWLSLYIRYGFETIGEMYLENAMQR
jgi:predicted GNAT family N-acyltransferase